MSGKTGKIKAGLTGEPDHDPAQVNGQAVGDVHQPDQGAPTQDETTAEVAQETEEAQVDPGDWRLNGAMTFYSKRRA